MQPDVAAPGLNILAAWSPAMAKLSSNILSGTSMACPHVTGIVALIKAVHPSWSPSAIKSAIMTTGKPAILMDYFLLVFLSFTHTFLLPRQNFLFVSSLQPKNGTFLLPTLVPNLDGKDLNHVKHYYTEILR